MQSKDCVASSTATISRDHTSAQINANSVPTFSVGSTPLASPKSSERRYIPYISAIAAIIITVVSLPTILYMRIHIYNGDKLPTFSLLVRKTIIFQNKQSLDTYLQSKVASTQKMVRLQRMH